MNRSTSPSTRGFRQCWKYLALTGALIAGVAGLELAQPAQQAVAATQPRLAPIAWELEFRYRDPRRIVVEVDGRSRAYWYMVYTVANYTDRNVMFIPEFDMLAGDGSVTRANENVPRVAFDAIQDRTRGVDLVSPQAMVGFLRIGEDEARSSVAIWPEPMRRMGTFDIFVAGLSGEIVPLTTPDGETITDEEDNPILLRKTKHLRYRIRGDGARPSAVPPVRLEERWIHR